VKKSYGESHMECSEKIMEEFEDEKKVFPNLCSSWDGKGRVKPRKFRVRGGRLPSPLFKTSNRLSLINLGGLGRLSRARLRE